MAAQVLMNKGVRPAMPVRAARTSVRVSAVAPASNMKKAGAAFMAIGSLAQVQPALAQEADAVDSAINSVIDVVKATGGAVKTGVDAVGAGVKLVQQGIEVATPVVKQGYEAVAPVVEQAARVAGDVAVPALKAAAPSFEEATKAIKNSGVDVNAISSTTDAVVKTTASGISTATPVVQNFVTFLAAQDAVTLGEYALGAVAVYFLLPPTLGALFGSLRGFAGEITAATALDALANEGNSVLIDIRTPKEKEGSGVPDVPSGAGSKLVEVEFASTEDKKLRGQLRDAFAIEAQVTALQIASLKKLGKGSKIILLDRYGGLSKTVAKELSRRGYGKVYVVSGGFDGRGGWVQSKLQIKPYTVVSGASAPAPVFGTLAKTISTRVANKRALPAPKA